MPLFSGNIKKIVDESERKIVDYLNKHPRLDVNEPVFPESKEVSCKIHSLLSKQTNKECVKHRLTLIID